MATNCAPPFRDFQLEISSPHHTVGRVNESPAVIYSTHGQPESVLEFKSLPISPIGRGMVRIRLLAATIHASDFGMIEGSYGRLPTLPTVGGREGVGAVVEVGPDVANLKTGDRVRMPEALGAWRNEVVAPAADCWPIPADIPLDLAAMAWINPPTAWRMLRDSHLSDGAWVAQNAANSAVGQFVIQMARHLGLRTLNVVRRTEYREPLLAMGGDQVVLEDSGFEKRVTELTGGQPVQLALNAVGGDSAIRLVRTLGNGGTHITYGAMTSEPVRFPTRFLIFNDVQLTGFWMDRWYRNQSPERTRIMLDRVFDLMRTGKLAAPVAARFTLDRIGEAVAAARSSRLGKVLLLPAAV
jgi:mitochondrial enoyl-[acyl-carrier protein] reductase / trans-2-enoyl-CoA reductase